MLDSCVCRKCGCARKLRAGLITIAYDKNHEIVYIEVLDPISVVHDVPPPAETTDDEDFEEYVEEMAKLGHALTPAETVQARDEWDKMRARVNVCRSAAANAAFELAFKKKLKQQLDNNYATMSKLLEQSISLLSKTEPAT